MKSLIVLLCACFLTIFSSSVDADEREKALKLVDNALVLVRQICVYTVILKNGNETKNIVNEALIGMGSGAFVDRPQAKPNQYSIFSAGHVVDCSVSWYARRFADAIPPNIDVVELKSSFLSTEIKYKGVWYSASVEALKFGDVYPDYALLLTTILPDEVKPHLLPYGLGHEDYGIGSRIIFRGYMGMKNADESVGSENGMMIMLDEAIIQYMGENFFRISLSSYPGNSGAPILYFKNGKYYIIGVVSAGFFLAPGISLRSAMITDLNFLNNEYENAPQ